MPLIKQIGWKTTSAGHVIGFSYKPPYWKMAAKYIIDVQILYLAIDRAVLTSYWPLKSVIKYACYVWKGVFRTRHSRGVSPGPYGWNFLAPSFQWLRLSSTTTETNGLLWYSRINLNLYKCSVLYPFVCTFSPKMGFWRLLKLGLPQTNLLKLTFSYFGQKYLSVTVSFIHIRQCALFVHIGGWPFLNTFCRGENFLNWCFHTQ